MLHCIYCCYLIQSKQTPVYAAAFNGHAGALNVLIGAKADVNAADVVRLDIHFTQNDFYVTNNKINLSGQKANRRSSICYMYVYLYPHLLPCAHNYVTRFGKTDLMWIVVDSSYEPKYTLDQLTCTMVFQIITLRKNTTLCLRPGAEVMAIRARTCLGEVFLFVHSFHH